MTTSPPDDLALLVRLLKLGSFINTPMADGVCEPAGIGQLELKVLMALYGEGPLAGHDLVGIMGIPAMSVSRALAALRARGWVEVAVDTDNRRRKPVKLTAEGRAGYERLTPLLQAVAAELLGGLRAAERTRFAASADKINAAMADWIVGHHAEVKLGG